MSTPIDFSDLVSVIMPAYNTQEYIFESIQSVLNQSSVNIELIIIDDASTDDTVSIVKKNYSNDLRVRLLANSKNLGPGIARNKGLICAKGRFIAFLDSDDIWVEEKLQKQIKFMLKKGIGMSYTQFRRFRELGNDVGRLIDIPIKLSYYELLKNTAIATSTVMIDKNVVGDIPIINVSKNYLEDYIIFYSILKKGFCAFGLKEDLMRYRVVKGSFSRNKYNYAMKVWKTYRKIENLNILSSFYYFCHYAIRGLVKYSKF